MAAGTQDVFETSSFSSLILQEEIQEIIPLDLHAACLIGDTETVNDLIQQKVDLDKINKGGWTSLMYAAYVGRDNILKLLLGSNAKVDVKSKKHGQTALMIASYCASESIMYFLLQNGACINMQDHTGRTSISHAVKRGHQSAVNLLATHGADVDLSEYSTGLSPLMEAAISGFENIFNILLNHGANIHMRSKSGETARNIAVRHRHSAIVNLIDIAAQTICTQISEERTLQREDIDINQGPREFMQNYADQGMEKVLLIDSSLKIMDDNKSNELPDASDMNRYNNNNKERFTQWQSTPGLPPKVHKLFEEFNVLTYLPLFEKQGIDVAAFLTLTDEDMKNMGVEKLGPRKRIKLVIDRYRQHLMKVHNSVEVEPLQNENKRLNIQLQQAVSYIQHLQEQLRDNEQQHRSAMSQIIYYMKDVGKNCKDVIGHLNDVSEHHHRMEMVLNDTKNSKENENSYLELRNDCSLLESFNSIKCNIEIATNCLGMTYKQVETTLNVAEMDIPLENQSS